MRASAVGFGKQRSGFLIVGSLLLVVLATHIPTLFFLKYDASKVSVNMEKQEDTYTLS